MSKETEEELYAKEAKEAGVELEELETSEPETPDKPEEDKPETPKQDKEDEEEVETEDEDESSEEDEEESEESTENEPSKSKGRKSIYKEYKAKRQELRQTREEKVALETTVSELQQTIKDMQSNNTEKKDDANSNFDQLLNEISEEGGDPELVKKIRESILSEVESKSKIDPKLQESIDRFHQWEKDNSQAINEQKFSKSFTEITPDVKEMFPSINDSELKELQSELKELSEDPEWKDKELDYVLYKNKSTLSALISPKKKGIEKKGRHNDNASKQSTTFDPNVDMSKMTPEQMENYEKAYNALSSRDGDMKDSDGRDMIL